MSTSSAMSPDLNLGDLAILQHSVFHPEYNGASYTDGAALVGLTVAVGCVSRISPRKQILQHSLSPTASRDSGVAGRGS